jgi:hypothetical protein
VHRTATSNNQQQPHNNHNNHNITTNNKMSDTAAESATETVHVDKKMRHTLSEKSCPICLADFNELTDVGMVILPGCQHAFCLTCVAKDQAQNQKTQCSICKREHTVVIKFPTTADEPQVMKMVLKVGCLSHTVQTFFSICLYKPSYASPQRQPSFLIDSRDFNLTVNNRRIHTRDCYLIEFELDIKRFLPPCPFEMRGGCDEVHECGYCKNITENATEYVSCYVNVKDGQAEFVFPPFVNPTLMPVTTTAAATVSVPLTTTL